MKFKILDPKATQQRLQILGYKHLKQQEERDTYFNAPDRDFAQTDEALRIRQIGSETILTYKGPKLGQQGKVRTEIEVPISADVSANKLHQLLIHLGYRPVKQVVKVRTFFRHPDQPDLELAWDEVEGLETYLEIEIKAEEQQRQQTLARLQVLAKELRLGQEERRSYLELLLGCKSSEVETSIQFP